jgi:hypothetical protein
MYQSRCNRWFKTHHRITENAAQIYGECLGDCGMSATSRPDIVAVHTFEPIGVIAECVRDGVTMYETFCGNSDVYDADLDGVIDYLWNEFVKHEI